MRRFGIALGLVAALFAGRLSASGLWPHHPTTITSPFYRAWLHHQKCGKEPSGPITYGYYGAVHQKFPHCTMTFSRVFVAHLGTTATPRPTHTPLPTIPAPPPATPTPSPTSKFVPTAVPTVLPTPTPWIIFVPVTPTSFPAAVPVVTSPPPGGLSTDPVSVSYELSLLNTTRLQYGVAPLSLNGTQSNGTATCAGSYGHSLAMAQSGQIWHQNAQYPAASFPTNLCVLARAAGENVGEGSAFGDPRPMLQQLHNSMMAEGTSNCASVISHACNIINPAFNQVGIGIVVQNGAVWLTTDFIG